MNIKEIQRILSESKVINLKNKDKFPEGGPIYIVGLGNDNYECHEFYDIKYSDHMPDKNTWGGYYRILEDTHHGWWTMNHNYNNSRNFNYAFVVNSEEDGDILAEYLNHVKDFEYIDIDIIEKRSQIQKLKDEIELLNEMKIIMRNKLSA